jgi:hypothetical protein
MIAAVMNPGPEARHAGVVRELLKFSAQVREERREQLAACGISRRVAGGIGGMPGRARRRGRQYTETIVPALRFVRCSIEKY